MIRCEVQLISGRVGHKCDAREGKQTPSPARGSHPTCACCYTVVVMHAPATYIDVDPDPLEYAAVTSKSLFGWAKAKC